MAKKKKPDDDGRDEKGGKAKGRGNGRWITVTDRDGQNHSVFIKNPRVPADPDASRAFVARRRAMIEARERGGVASQQSAKRWGKGSVRSNSGVQRKANEVADRINASRLAAQASGASRFGASPKAPSLKPSTRDMLARSKPVNAYGERPDGLATSRKIREMRATRMETGQKGYETGYSLYSATQDRAKSLAADRKAAADRLKAKRAARQAPAPAKAAGRGTPERLAMASQAVVMRKAGESRGRGLASKWDAPMTNLGAKAYRSGEARAKREQVAADAAKRAEIAKRPEMIAAKRNARLVEVAQRRGLGLTAGDAKKLVSAGPEVTARIRQKYADRLKAKRAESKASAAPAPMTAARLKAAREALRAPVPGDVRDRFKAAMTRLEPQAATGAPISLAALRGELKDVAPRKKQFDRIVRKLNEDGTLALHRNDAAFVGTTKPADRFAMVRGTRQNREFNAQVPGSRRVQGDYYNAANLREQAQPKAAKVAKTKAKGGYLEEQINFGGETMSRGKAIAAMQKDGHPQHLIDRYMQGASRQAQAQAPARSSLREQADAARARKGTAEQRIKAIASRRLVGIDSKPATYGGLKTQRVRVGGYGSGKSYEIQQVSKAGKAAQIRRSDYVGTESGGVRKDTTVLASYDTFGDAKKDLLKQFQEKIRRRAERLSRARKSS